MVDVIAKRLVQAAAVGILGSKDYARIGVQVKDLTREAEGATVGVLRELAEVDRTVMGGDVFLDSIFDSIADAIEGP